MSLSIIGVRPAFFANKTSAQTPITQSAFVQVTFPNVVFNIGTYFSTGTNAWTPPAGKVWIRASLGNGGTTSAGATEKIAIYKNGTIYHEFDNAGIAGNGGGPFLEIDDSANGTDAYTVYGWNPATTSRQFNNDASLYFCGRWFAP